MKITVTVRPTRREFDLSGGQAPDEVMVLDGGMIAIQYERGGVDDQPELVLAVAKDGINGWATVNRYPAHRVSIMVEK